MALLLCFLALVALSLNIHLLVPPIPLLFEPSCSFAFLSYTPFASSYRHTYTLTHSYLSILFLNEKFGELSLFNAIRRMNY